MPLPVSLRKPLQTALSALALTFASAAMGQAQSLLPGKDLETARQEAVAVHDYFDLAAAGETINYDAYGLFFSPPRRDYEWSTHTRNYRLLLALSATPEDTGHATLLAAAAALNAGRNDHAEALAQEALVLLDDGMDRRLARSILQQLDQTARPDYTDDVREHIWTLSRQVGLFGPMQSTAAQDGDYARLCLRFSRPLSASTRVDFRDLVILTPAPPVQRFVMMSGGRELCVVGVAFEQTYTMDVRAELTSRVGDTLREPVSVTLTTPGRRAEVRLPGQGYVLPASGTQLVPVETVNLQSIEVGLYHLEERNISRVLRQGVLSYDPSDIAIGRDAQGYIVERTGAFRKQVRTLFEGRLSVDALRHERRRDGISFASMLGEQPIERGLYLLTVKAPDSGRIDAVKWLMVSDLALSTIDTPEGLFVQAIDTRTGEALTENVKVALVTRGNRELSPTPRSVGPTAAYFAAAQLKGKDADEPLYLYASHPTLGDGFIALGRSPIEIDTPTGLKLLNSDPLDLWAKADRGVYREGETARVVGLLRANGRADAQDVLLPRTLHARVINPGGDVAQRFDVSLTNGGGFEAEVPLPFGARQGQWSLDLALGEGLPVLKSVPLPLRDFVPPSVEIALSPNVALKPLALDGSDTVAVQVDYLFGAPAQNLRVALNGRLRQSDGLDGFAVGLVEEEFVYAQPFNLHARTDADGVARFTLPAYNRPDQTTVAALELEAKVTDAAGREERTTQRVLLADPRLWMGLKPDFDASEPVAENSTVTFTAAALQTDPLTGAAALVPAQARWTLYREVYDYTWYFDGGRWNYESSYIDLPVAEGMLDLIGETSLSLDVDQGAYRLEVVSEDGLSATSMRFNAGWLALPQVDRVPGRIGVTLAGDKPSPGETITLVIDTPHAGPGLALLVGSRTQVLDLGPLQEGANTLTLDLPKDWPDEAGLWVLPAVSSAGAMGADRLPGRSVGALFVSFDASDTLLDLDLEHSNDIRPREPLQLAASVGALAEDERGYMLAWLVDDGVLSMTGYQSPKPAAHFLSAFALPADLRDTFAALIASEGLKAAPLKQGFGDEYDLAMAAMAPDDGMSLSQGLTTRIRETLALSTAIVPLDAQGRATLSLQVPDFVGRARLMTLAWTDQGRMGAEAERVLIRDPIVADLFLPRFLAPGDAVDVKLLLSNTQARAFDTRIEISPSTGLRLQEGAGEMRVLLAAQGQHTLPLRLKAGAETGAQTVTVSLHFGGETLTRKFPIEVRAPSPRTLERETLVLAPGDAMTLEPSLLADLDDLQISLGVGPATAIDASALSRQLEAYPYRCTEQTTARAIGLLLGRNLPMTESARQDALREALVTLQNRRGSGGLVSLWPGYQDGDLFLHAFVTDFLGLAAEQGMQTAADLRPGFVSRLRRGVERAEDPYYGDQLSLRSRAYALAVLARAGAPDIGAQRLLIRDLLAEKQHVFAAAALAVAAHAVGDMADRDTLIDRLLPAASQTVALDDDRSDKTRLPGEIEDYGTQQRDWIAALALLTEAGLNDHAGVSEVLATRLPLLLIALRKGRLSTQEQAWALRLAHQLGAGDAVSFEPLGDPWPERWTAQDFDGSRGLRNTGDAPLLVSLWQSGTPVTDTPALNTSVSLSRTLLDLDTLEPVTNPAPGQRLLVSLTGTALEDQPLDYILADLLPAGFEVETVGLPEGLPWAGGRVGECGQGEATALLGQCLVGGRKAFQQTDTEFAEARADRVLFSFETAENNFALYYVLRRTQSGSVTLPGAHIEAMYAPDIRARTAARQLD